MNKYQQYIEPVTESNNRFRLPVDDVAVSQQPEPVSFSAITSAELASADYELEYLIEGMFVKGQPGIIAGPKKSLKTNILIDLVLSLSDGLRFLNRFAVTRPVRVGMMSGESGAATIQETAHRIALSKHNLTLACRHCNWVKAAMTPMELLTLAIRVVAVTGGI